MEEVIADKIKEALNPTLLFIENESHMHSGPRTESHFKIYVVSDSFKALQRIDRQRLINELLSEELENNIHALTMRLKTPSEHDKKNGTINFISPNCSSKKL